MKIPNEKLVRKGDPYMDEFLSEDNARPWTGPSPALRG